MNDSPGRDADDDDVRANLRSHVECIAHVFDNACVDARREYPRAGRFRCLEQAALEHLTKPRLQFEVLNSTVDTNDLREDMAALHECASRWVLPD